ncbi:hypothetical protein HDC90_003476 [Pedobacter sp. AK013]|nr:hypothetical protein [Pedobacter sp. AK013]
MRLSDQIRRPFVFKCDMLLTSLEITVKDLHKKTSGMIPEVFYSYNCLVL